MPKRSFDFDASWEDLQNPDYVPTWRDAERVSRENSYFEHNKKQRTEKRDCKFGPECVHLRRGSCRFNHPEVEASRAVFSDDPKQPKCPKCSTPMVLKQKNGEFWACPRYPQCKSTIPVADPKNKCDRCGAGMVERGGEHGSFLGCSRYPACHNTITAKSQEKQKLLETPIRELWEKCLLDTQTKDRLETFLRSVNLSDTGTKADLISRIEDHFDPPPQEELERRKEQKARQREAEKREREAIAERERLRLEAEARAEKERIDKFNATMVVPPKDVITKNFPHEQQWCIWPQRHGNIKSFQESFGCAARCDLKTLPEVKDFAVGITSNYARGRIIFYNPNKGIALSPATEMNVKDVGSEQIPATGPIDYYTDTKGNFWMEIFKDSDHVYVIFREGRWTDSEMDFDKCYIPRSHGEPGGRCWAFCVPEAVYHNAWSNLSQRLHSSPPSSVPEEDCLDEKKAKKMKVVDLKSWLQARNLPIDGLKADLVARVVEACSS